MDTSKLKKFAGFARRELINQVGARLEYVLSTDSGELRAKENLITQIKNRIEKTSKEVLIEDVAYVWFNRFCALRFMDVNRYNSMGIISPTEGQTQPEILAEAKQGHIDERFLTGEKADHIFKLLAGTVQSNDAQSEAYRHLIIAVCNFYHQSMPYLFALIDDFTELLMPDDLLSNNSILAYIREALTPDACKDVEVIGWLYQYYISAKKDQIFEDLKKRNKKITPENIPAATQLFTPHWIVRYLVENSLGRLWLMNNPQSNLKAKMDYYIDPEAVDTDFLRITSPEELKICDPACGSGHMLTYAFDLLYHIYQEQGYDESEIPTLILTKNLYGIEIDERAAELAAFALSMKAREKHRRFFDKQIAPNICVLENIALSDSEIARYKQAFGEDLFSSGIVQTLSQFTEVKNFGSLIQPKAKNPHDILNQLWELRHYVSEKLGTDKTVNREQMVLLTSGVFDKITAVLRQADYLSQKYHIVVANPPYMGGGNMNPRLGAWLKETYPDSKSDLFAAFIERGFELVQQNGYSAMVTMQSWMFLSSYEKLRAKLLNHKTILSMAHLGSRAFDSIGGEVVSTTAFTLKNSHHETYKGQYLRLIDGNSEAEKQKDLIENKTPNNRLYFTASASDFKKIPGSPIAYWVSDKVREVFASSVVLKSIGDTRQGMATSDNNRFLRLWHEVSEKKSRRNCSNKHDAALSGGKWFPYNKGGDFRKWYGNSQFYVNWADNGKEIIGNASSLYGSATRTIKSMSEYFKESVSWSKISSSHLAMRYYPAGYIFDVAGCCIFSELKSDLKYIIGLCNTNMIRSFLQTISPTLNFEAGHIANLPVLTENRTQLSKLPKTLIDLSKSDWDSYETSWDFACLPLLSQDYKSSLVKQSYEVLRSDWQQMTDEMKTLEEENNRIFINAYGLQDELTPDVPLSEITLTCNPYYRYGGKNSDDDLERKLLNDTIQEFIHYAIGCMFGRYSLDKQGLILANAGECLQDYLKQIPKPTFDPDSDNVIPILDKNWFSDDIVERFQKFLMVTFGLDNYNENLAFIEDALGKDLRKYFIKDFYEYHVRRYKKRPIYWLFSSPKGSFNALIYMHRYRPDTVSVILNDYLREFITKLENEKQDLKKQTLSGTVSDKDKIKTDKEINKLNTMLDELKNWERDVVFPLANEKIQIDLDDGVKINYPKFGSALKTIKGLDAHDNS